MQNMQVIKRDGRKEDVAFEKVQERITKSSAGLTVNPVKVAQKVLASIIDGISTTELDAMIIYQLGALHGIARAAGHRMTHMSLHGALGNMAAADALMADHLMRAVASFDRDLIVVSSTSRAIEAAAARHGLRLVTTFLADRAYDDDGLLVPRSTPGSVIHAPEAVLERVRLMLTDGIVIAQSGKALATRPGSILLHGDTAGAASLAALIRREIEAIGCSIVPVSRQAG
jgi:UPF0271 protein